MMKPVSMGRMSSIGDVMARVNRDKEIYDALSPEEKREVDNHNAMIAHCYGDIEAIIALGDHPMKRFRARAGEQ